MVRHLANPANDSKPSDAAQRAIRLVTDTAPPEAEELAEVLDLIIPAACRQDAAPVPNTMAEFLGSDLSGVPVIGEEPTNPKGAA